MVWMPYVKPGSSVRFFSFEILAEGMTRSQIAEKGKGPSCWSIKVMRVSIARGSRGAHL